MRPTFQIVVSVIVSIAAAMQASGQATQPDRAQLSRAWRSAYDAKNWQLAIEIGKKLTELDPAGGLHSYNLACAYALSGDSAQALTALTKAVNDGFSDDDLLASDADLASVRNEKDYDGLLKRVKQNAEIAFEKFKKSGDERVIRTFVPDNLDPSKPAPLIVALHGYGGSANDIARSWRESASRGGAILIAPQAPQPLDSGVGFAWGTVRTAEYLVQNAIEKTRAAHKIDEKRVILSGFSQGGLMAYAIGLRNPKQFCGVIPVAAVYNEALRPNKDDKTDWPRFYIMVGMKDQVLPQNQQAARHLAEAAIPCKLVTFENLGHMFPMNREEELKKALDFVLVR